MAKKAVFTGSLEFLGLPDLLQFLGTNGSTGVLRLTNPFSLETGLVFLQKGKPVNASNGSLDGLEALYSLFGWTTGEFKFTQEKIHGKKSIHKSQMEIILDGLRMLDEGVIKKIAPDSLKKGKSGPLDSGFKLPLITKSIPNYFLVVGEDQFQDGATIIEEGVFGNWIYIVLDGTAEMSKNTERGPVKILNAGPGAFVGNISSAIKQGFRRIVTMTASGNVQLGVLDQQSLHDEYSSLSTEFRGVLLSLDNRFKEVTERLSETPTKSLKSTAFFNDGHVVAKKSTMIDKAFVITRGNALMLRDMEKGHLPLAKLNKGDFFGQIPFLDIGHEPHSSSVFLSKNLKTVELDLDTLQSEYDQISDTLRSIIEFSVYSISIATLAVCERYPQKRI